jgi:superfamily II DNA or RNA helicase
MLRKHQLELIELLNKKIDQIKKEGRNPNSEVADIVASVFPGGGKSSHPIIAFKLLKEAGLVDKLCWIVPRASLQKQGAEGFLDVKFKELFPHDIEIRETAKSNEKDPSHGHDGYITTYQSISTAYNSCKSSKKLNYHEVDFKKYRYLLFLDECQHTTPNKSKSSKISNEDEDGFSFYESILPLFKSAHFNIASSGSLYRHDSTEKVAFVDYKIVNDLEDIQAKVDLFYDYDDAMSDKAIIQLYASLGGLKCLSYKRGDEEIERDDFKTNIDLAVAIDSGYGKQLLCEGIKHWQDYKQRTNKRSKMIIVGHSQKHCREICVELNSQHIKHCLAISDEKKDGRNAIVNFRTQQNCDVLVTCQMAYEGLDCKEATHIIGLTRIRSKPWLHQMLTRVMRSDPKNELAWKHQYCYAFVPCDAAMKKSLSLLKAKEIEFVNNSEELPYVDISRETIDPEIKLITDIHSDLEHVSYDNLDGITVPPELNQKILMYQNKYNFNQSEIDTYKMLIDTKTLHLLDQFISTEEIEEVPVNIHLTVSQRENKLKKEIQTIAGRLDYKFGYPHGAWNKRIFNHFRYRSRQDMNIEELTAVRKWLIKQATIEADRVNRNRTRNN